MVLRNYDLSKDFQGVHFDCGTLKFSVRDGANSLTLLIVEPRDNDYLAAMTWAIANNKL